MQKRSKKNQGKHDASGRFALPAPRDQYTYNLTIKRPIPFFSSFLETNSSQMPLGWQFTLYARSKSKNAVVAAGTIKTGGWVSIKLKTVFQLA